LEVIGHDGQTTTEKQYADQMRARATPLFVYYDKAGNDVLRLTGYQEPGIFMTAVRYVSSEAYKDGTSFLTFVRSGK
jgi:thioredoxin-related protein